MLHWKKLGGTILVFSLIAAASAASYVYLSSANERSTISNSSEMAAYNLGDSSDTPAAAPKSDVGNSRGTYIVIFKEAALASYKGGKTNLPMPTKRASANGKLRLDTKSYEARNYVSYLQDQQGKIEKKMSGFLGGQPMLVRQRMQHAINGIVVDLSPLEAAKISEMPEVMLVEEYREYEMDTDTGPALIGAPAVWNGTNPGASAAYQGEGIVVGIIDSGINFGSPSFAAIDPVDAYSHVNPLGDSIYLGTCVPGGIDAGRCNSKLIGGYDFVCAAPANQCGVVNIREEPGFGDTSSHGSHTASTVAGNRRDVVFSGSPRRISGVAPRANVIAYDVCYTNTATGRGLCPNVSSVAAVNQALADGIVDTVNFSIGGGVEPWSDAVSLAFLNATDAGIYVAASAGNSGPGANTLGHVEPWVASTAAAQHGRGGFAVLMQVTGPAPVPADLAPLAVNQGSGGVDFAATIPGTTPLIVSAGIDSVGDACNALPVGSFNGAIALVRRGTCSFATKTNNASAAGAIAIVIANSAAGTLLPSVPGTTIPVFTVTQLQGNALRDFTAANPTATAQISFPAVGLPNTADALAAFSSRGPAGRFDLLKPDMTAPGVDILAVIAGTTITGSEQAIGLMSGTSMSSPHHAGAAALIRQARPTWTVSEIKSALMMTAIPVVYTEDQITPANAFAKGSGRIQVDRAINTGLVLHETMANYQAANPATGGNPASLNLPSYANGRCFPTCQFTRTFRNPLATSGLWSVRLQGVPGTVMTPLISIAAGQTSSVTFTINARRLQADGNWNFGHVELTPRASVGRAAGSSVLRLPVAVAVPPPMITVPASVSSSIASNANTTVDITVGNIGGSILDYTVTNNGSGTTSVATAERGAVNSGSRSTIYSDPATAANAAQFAADDFDVTATTQITSVSTDGFVVSGALLSTAATNLTWSIYPNAAGVPAGNPRTSPGAALWTYTAAPTAAGVTTTATGGISLNLLAAGQTVSLAPGKYWLVVNTAGTFANRWVQFGSATGNGSFMSINVATNLSGTWTSNTAFAGLNMVVRGLVPCGAPWLGAAFPATGRLAPTQTGLNSVAINGTGLSAGNYVGRVCINSNDPVRPSVAVPVLLTVTP